MKAILTIFLMCLLTVSVSAQKALTPKQQLETAISKSKKAVNFRSTAEVRLGQNDIFSTFEYLAPNKYYLLEKNAGKIVKEMIEINRQRYQKKDDQWIKTRLDYLPLREQFESVFQVTFSSKLGDHIRIRKVEVKFLGDDVIAEKNYRKYEFTHFYNDSAFNSSGIAWVNLSSGLLERVELNSVGLFGSVTSVWNYYYDQDIKIEPPKDFVEQDWVN